MSFKPPEADDIKTIVSELGHEINDEKAANLLQCILPFAESYHYIDQQNDELPPVKYPDRSYRTPQQNENTLGAWHVHTTIKGSGSGPLQGKRVAIKDNIFMADVPLLNGTSFLQRFVPEFDATVITRLLDAGADITGKAVCEFLCVSGFSVSAISGAVRNPVNPEYSAGGSSSGSAALVGSGDVDMSLGCDQAGSIRIPSSCCGVYGMKPTFGLVPYTGIISIEQMIDHVGPITANVSDNALMLEVLAGYDDLDSRQQQLHLHKYTEALGQDVSGMTIGIVNEGFGHPLANAAVDECVRDAAARFLQLGAKTEDVSIPMHAQGVAIWGAVVMDALNQTMQMNGTGYNYNGVYSPAFHEAMHNWEGKLLEESPINVWVLLLLGKYMERYRGKYYAKAKNLIRTLCRAYDNALEKYDLLLMPTLINLPAKLPKNVAEVTAEEIFSTFDTILNTCQFDISGHPAMTIPCGMRDGLPVGMMLIGKHFDEPPIYRAAHAFEQSGDWKTM